MHAPETRRAVVVMQTYLCPYGIDIAVLAHSRRVISYFTGRQYATIAEGVLAVRIDILGIKRERKVVRQFDIYAHIRIRQSERTGSHLGMDMHFLVRLKIRFTGREIDVTGGTELTGRLEDIGFLSVEELDLLHVIKGETT